jgi:uncharacterized phage protein (TIGR02218 family)
MRQFSSQMIAALTREATTLCHCWRLTRRDGFVLGFTDHDRDLTFDDLVYKANAALDGFETEATSGFSIGAGEVAGAFVDEAITQEDLSAGRYDDAAVEVWLVDWDNVSARALLDVATIGEVSRGEFAFKAEIRSLAHKFDQETGRQFQRGCSAQLGDARCGLALENSAFAYAACVEAIGPDGDLTVSMTAEPASGVFSYGRLLTGDARAFAIKSDAPAVAGRRLSLWGEKATQIDVGAKVTLIAGCDKSAQTCRDKFANIVNFRGFPHIPGNDATLAYARPSGASMDGGSLFQ